MNGAWDLVLQFASVTVAATAIGVIAYMRLNREPWPLTTRIGVSLGGAAIGVFAGGLLLLVSSLQGWPAVLLVLLIATGTSVWFQHKVHAEQFLDLL